VFDGKVLIPEEAVNLEPLSSLEALDPSEPDDVRELLNLIAKEAGLRAPDIDANGLIAGLPQRNFEEQDADGKLPDRTLEWKSNQQLLPTGNKDLNLFLSSKHRIMIKILSFGACPALQ
jgi:hypothetical protein